MKATESSKMMKMDHTLELVGKKGSIQILKSGEAVKIAAQAGEKYRIVKKHGASEVAADDVVATQVGDTLQLQYADGTQVSLEGFYQADGSEMILPASNGGLHSVSSQDGVAISSAQSNNFVYAHGNHDVLMSMTQENYLLQTAIAEHTSVANLSHYAEAATGVAADAIAGGTGASGAAAGVAAGTGAAAGMSTVAMVGLGALGVGAAVAVTAGGGGDSSGAAAAPAGDTTSPVLLSTAAHSANQTVVMTYDSALDSTHAPIPANFTITTGGTANPVASVTISGSTVTLTLTNPFSAADAVTVNYTDPSTGNDTNAIQDASGNDAATVSVSGGVVADGYVRNAQIWIDTDNNGTADYNTGVVTNAYGNFILPPNTPHGTIVAIGGVNIDTGVPNTMPLRAPEGSTVINPLTTLVQAYIQANTTSTTTVTAAQASEAVVAALGLTTGTNLSTYDPIASNDLSAQKAAASVATIVTLGAGTDTAAAAAIITNLVTEIKTATTAVDLTDTAVLTTLVGSSVEVASIQSATSDINLATTLNEITFAQSVALDTIAPGASTLMAAALTNDPRATIQVNLDTLSMDGKAAVAGDVVKLIIDNNQVFWAILSAENITAQYVNFNEYITEGTHYLSAYVVDQTGHTGDAYSTVTTSVDLTLPGLTVTSDQRGTDITYTFTFSEAVTGFTADVFTVANGTAGTFTALSSTVYTLVVTPAPGFEGDVTITVAGNAAFDAAGNSDQYGFTLTKPVLSAPTIALTTDSGKSPADQLTNDAALTLSIPANGVTRTFVVDNGTPGAAYTAPTADGLHTVVVTDTDEAGNSASTTLNFTLDKTAPSAPTIALTTDSGTSAADQLTNDAALTLSIPANGVTRTFVVDNGIPTAAYTAPTADGAHTVIVIDTDEAGNNASTTLNFTLDKTALSAPTIALTTDSGSAADGITNSAALTLSVLETGVTRTFTVDNGTPGAVYTAPTTDGLHTVVVTDTDAAGNTSTASLSFTLDTTAPAVTIDPITADSVLNAAEVTDGGAITGTTTAENGQTVAVTVDGIQIGTATVTDGKWSLPVSSAALATLTQGDHSITADTSDITGNSAVQATRLFSVDTVAPTSPASTISNATSDNILNAAENIPGTKTISGTNAEIGASVVVKIDGNIKGSPATVNPDGTWSVTYTTTGVLAEGEHTRSAEITDAAGNVGIVTKTFTVDTTAPTITVDPIGTLNAAEIATGGLVSGTTTAEDGQIVTVKVDGTPIGTAIIANGVWSIDVSSATAATLSDGFHTITADVSDKAGNPAIQGSSTFSVDTIAPSGTISNATSDNILNASENVAGQKTITGTSNAEAGSTVIVKIDGNTKGNTTVQSDGTWSLTYTTTGVLADGEHTRSAEITDAAGNVGIVTKTFTVDTIAPAQPNVTLATDSGIAADGITNSAALNVSALEVGTTRTFTVDNGTPGAAYTAPTTDGVHTVVVTDTDVAGNTSAASLAFILDATAPSAASSAAVATYDVVADSLYGATDTITIRFSEAVDTAKVTLANLTLSNGHTFGTGAAIVADNASNGYASSYTITLGNGTNIAGSDTITIALSNVVDTAGNSAASNTVFTIPATIGAPTITIAATLEGDNVVNAAEDNTVTIMGTTSAEEGQIVTVTLSDGVHTAVTTTATVSGGSWTAADADISALSNGNITVTANVSNQAGNAAIPATATLILDNIAPTVTAAMSIQEDVNYNMLPNGSTTGYNSFYINGETSDHVNAEGATFAIYDGTTRLGTVMATGSLQSFHVVGATNGTHTYTYRAEDAAGNAGPATAAYTLTVDTSVVPTATATVNAIATTIDTTPTITGTVSGAVMDTYKVNVYINGNLVTPNPVAISGSAWSYTPDASLLDTFVYVSNPSGASFEVTAVVVNTANATQGPLSTPASLVIDIFPPEPLTYQFSDLTDTVVIGNVEAGAKAYYSLYDGLGSYGEWIEITGNSFTLNGAGHYFFKLKQVDALGNESVIGGDVTVTDPLIPESVFIHSATLIAPESDITQLPSGTYTDGYVTVDFDAMTATEANGTSHTLSLSGGVLSIDGMFSYKLLASTSESLVLGQTDRDVTGEMNGTTQGPPPILTLVNTAAATADPLPSGALTLYTTEMENFGDRNGTDWAKMAFSLPSGDGTGTVQGYAINGSEFPVQSVTISGNDLSIKEISTNHEYYGDISLISSANGYYTFQERFTEIDSWGAGSAGYYDAQNSVWVDAAATIGEYLAANNDYLWQENGTDYNNNGTTDDYGRVLRDANGTVTGFETKEGTAINTDQASISYGDLQISRGSSLEIYGINQNGTPTDLTDDAIYSINQGIEYFTLSAANPFEVSYAIEHHDMWGVSVELNSGNALNAVDLNYTNTLQVIDAETDTAANTITISADDVLRLGLYDPMFGSSISILGGANDTVNIGSGWTWDANKGGYTHLDTATNATANLYISPGVAVI